MPPLAAQEAKMLTDRNELCFSDATDLARGMARRELPAREVMEAHLARVERENPVLNAIVTLHSEEALEAADRADEAQRRGVALGPLHGLPVAHKDLFHTRGMRTTFGSPLFRDFVPKPDRIVVERPRTAAALAT